MRIKNGVRFTSPEQAMSHASMVIAFVYWQLGLELVITSGSDGQHMAGSLHYSGAALDYRVNHLTQEQRNLVIWNVKDRLGDAYDALIHGEGANIHLHVEYDPR